MRYGAQDQRQVVVAEIVGWRKKFGCDVVALQECEGPGPMEGLLGDYVFVGSAPAKATRGHVHLYVRKGLEYERVCEGSGGAPFVAARVKVCSEGGSRGPGEVCVVAVHLPSGERAAERARVLGDALRSVVAKGVERTGILVVGDCNVREDEVSELCDAEGMRDASYAGKTWGVSWNRFDKDAQYRGPGLRFDRAFFGKKLWAQGHLVARGPVSFEGAQFCKSDHFGLMVYVDAADAFAGKGKACVEAARVRRAAVAGACEGAAEREAQEVRAERQAAQEEKALEREKAGEKDRASFARAQQRGARERARRRTALREAAFGRASLFAENVVTEQPEGGGVVRGASAVAIPGTEGWRAGGWGAFAGLPRVGMRNLGNTCYISSVLQVLLRVPAIRACVEHHSRDECPRGVAAQDCVACLMRETLADVRQASGRGAVVPALARCRAVVHDQYSGGGQWDACEFFGHLFHKAREVEIEAGRWGAWGEGWLDGTPDVPATRWDRVRAAATHWDRLCTAVIEHRRRCRRCGRCRVKYEKQEMFNVEPPEDDRIPLTSSELYLHHCRPEATSEGNHVDCESCGSREVHDVQCRICVPPNVLVLRVNRRVAEGGQGVLMRQRVDVEEEMHLPGFPPMALAGVVYHNGRTVHSGHYTCLCRGPGGRFWMYDDSRVYAVEGEVRDQKPAQVLLMVYARSDGRATWEAAPSGLLGFEGGGVGAGGGRSSGASAETGRGVARVAGAGGSPGDSALRSAKRRVRRKRGASPSMEGRGAEDGGAGRAALTLVGGAAEGGRSRRGAAECPGRRTSRVRRWVRLGAPTRAPRGRRGARGPPMARLRVRPWECVSALRAP